ncbi:MAG: 50S ribosomal protein L15 [Alphaproteobacteria bacterium CG_4_10_14_0_2_um_filter_63_37]|nr:MAG: 50S ribosomal protein L15 [Alphaproteobacteria bacterium CG_4_10_14_0_2_um_filter_63_37]
MKLNELAPNPGSKTDRRRVGRGVGSGWGKTSAKGQKGQLSRSGASHSIGFEGGQMPLHRRVPKRGFHNPFRVAYSPVNLDQLEENFEAGDVVTTDVLMERGLVPTSRPVAKILARGNLTKKLDIKVEKASKAAVEKIQAAGGSIEQLGA